jgi:hypothetical protein
MDERTIEELRTVAKIVREELANDERARNDDKWLTWKVMRHFTNIIIPFEDFVKMPSFESIRRVRQKIQNIDNEFLPTYPTVIKRRLRERTIKQIINEV